MGKENRCGAWPKRHSHKYDIPYPCPLAPGKALAPLPGHMYKLSFTQFIEARVKLRRVRLVVVISAHTTPGSTAQDIQKDGLTLTFNMWLTILHRAVPRGAGGTGSLPLPPANFRFPSFFSFRLLGKKGKVGFIISGKKHTAHTLLEKLWAKKTKYDHFSWSHELKLLKDKYTF